MKRLRRSILAGLAVFAALFILAALFFLVRFVRATKKMTPSETLALNDSVWCIRDKFVNAYLFRTGNGYVLFDAGISQKNFRKELTKTGIDPAQVKDIFLTHTDGDHIGAIGLFPGARIYMHRDEEKMIDGTLGKTRFHKAHWKYGPYILLGDGDSLSTGGLKVRIIHTPGHTPGSACYEAGKDYLITGDNLTVNGKEYAPFLDMFNMDTPKQTASIKLLPPVTGYRYILTGHYGIADLSR